MALLASTFRYAEESTRSLGTLTATLVTRITHRHPAGLIVINARHDEDFFGDIHRIRSPGMPPEAAGEDEDHVLGHTGSKSKGK